MEELLDLRQAKRCLTFIAMQETNGTRWSEEVNWFGRRREQVKREESKDEWLS